MLLEGFDFDQLIDGNHLVHLAFKTDLDELTIYERIKEFKNNGLWNEKITKLVGKDGLTPLELIVKNYPKIIGSLFQLSAKYNFSFDDINSITGNTIFHQINLSLKCAFNKFSEILIGIKYLFHQLIDQNGQQKLLSLLTKKNFNNQDCVDLIFDKYQETTYKEENDKQKILKNLLDVANIYFEMFPGSFDQCKQNFFFQ